LPAAIKLNAAVTRGNSSRRKASQGKVALLPLAKLK
jgi:hypothetical protein